MSHEVRQQSSALLSKPLDHFMKVYCTAAITAGVSVLALAQPAASEVIVTKKNIPIPISFFGDGPQVQISLTNNGVNDFSFSLYEFAYHSVFRSLAVRALEGGAIVTGASGSRNAIPLVRGAQIGPSANFSPSRSAFIEHSRGVGGGSSSGHTFYNKSLGGDWGGNLKDRYLGIRFLINGKTHYGWIRLTVATTTGHGAMAPTITAYAYETVPNQVITAGSKQGDPVSGAQAKSQVPATTLGMLALGVDGLAIWRKEPTSN